MSIDFLHFKDGLRIEPLYLHEKDPVWLIANVHEEIIESMELRLERPDGRSCEPRIAAKLRRILSGMEVNKTGLNYHVTGTRFQRAVWTATCGIPPGCLTTYGAIAGIISCGSPRAVGQALKKNPLPIIIPCHRVIGRNRDLTGFSGGTEIKRMLIEFESKKRCKTNENSSFQRQP